MSEPNSKAKFQVRAIAKARLGGVTPQDAAAWSKAVCDHIMAWQAFERARTLMLFMPLAGEVDLRSLREEAIRLGKVVCLPRTDWQSRALNPVSVPSLGPGLVAARHGLLEPPAAAMALPISDLDLIVVPGLAFDSTGQRLGRGAGFYDRFLANPILRAFTCGVGFEVQLLDNLPIDRWDMPLHAIATERRLLMTGRTPPAAA